MTIKSAAQRVWLATAFPRTTRLLARLLGTRGRASELATLRDATNILVVRLDKIGDMVMMMPFLRELRRAYPVARITLLATPETRQVAAMSPFVDEVLTYSWHAAKQLGPMHVAHALWFALRTLRPRQFDLAILPRWDVDYYCASHLAHLCGAPRVVGFTECATRKKQHLNRAYDGFFTDVVTGPPDAHEVERNLHIVAHLGGSVRDTSLALTIPNAADARVDRLLVEANYNGTDALVAFSMHASASHRQWPLARFCEVASRLVREQGVRVVALGGPGEEAYGVALRAAAGTSVIDAIGTLSLAESAALTKRCRVFVGNDSGPMHIAAAVGTPVVAVSCYPLGADTQHGNAPERFGPWGDEHVVLRPRNATPPCHGGCTAHAPHCILALTVSEVVGATVARLQPSVDTGAILMGRDILADAVAGMTGGNQSRRDVANEASSENSHDA